VTASPRPLPVFAALVLLWAALAIAVVASVAYYRSIDTLPLADAGLHLVGYAILATLLVGIGAGNGWARGLLALFLAWQLALTLFNLVAGSTSLPGLYSLDRAILGLQLAGALLLFSPASQAWFRARNAGG
jgi:hypothetical protein